MPDETSNRTGESRTLMWLLVALGVGYLLPLGIALAEYFLLGTNHFGHLINRLGLDPTFTKIYQPLKVLIDLFR